MEGGSSILARRRTRQCVTPSLRLFSHAADHELLAEHVATLEGDVAGDGRQEAAPVERRLAGARDHDATHDGQQRQQDGHRGHVAHEEVAEEGREQGLGRLVRGGGDGITGGGGKEGGI